MMAMAMAPKIRVNGIAPGITLISTAQDQAEFERAHRNNPLQRGCQPEDILTAVDFIQQTPCYTGQVMILDGGTGLTGDVHEMSVFMINPHQKIIVLLPHHLPK